MNEHLTLKWACRLQIRTGHPIRNPNRRAQRHTLRSPRTSSTFRPSRLRVPAGTNKRRRSWLRRRNRDCSPRTASEKPVFSQRGVLRLGSASYLRAPHEYYKRSTGGRQRPRHQGAEEGLHHRTAILQHVSPLINWYQLKTETWSSLKIPALSGNYNHMRSELFALPTNGDVRPISATR